MESFADAPSRDIEYRDLYGLGTLGAAGSGPWDAAIDHFAPIYLKLRGYTVPWNAKFEDSPFVAAMTRFTAEHPVDARAMTTAEFRTHVGRVLLGTLLVTVAATGYVVYRRRKRTLRGTATQVSMADLSAWRSPRRRRRSR